MAEFPALPLWTDALIGDTYQLTPAEFGAYLRLLIVAWRMPNCALPNDDAFLGRSVGDPKNWHRLRTTVMAYWTMGSDGFWRQKRLLDERDYVSRCAARSSAGGRAKALKRQHRDGAQKVPNVCQTSAPTPTPTPTSTSNKKKEVEARATRWPPDQVVTEEWKEEGALKRELHGLPEIDLNLEAEKFVNYWSSKGGKDGAKRDWHKTWINWTLNARQNANGNGRQPSAHDKFFAAAESLIRGELERPAAGELDAPALPFGDPLLPP